MIKTLIQKYITWVALTSSYDDRKGYRKKKIMSQIHSRVKVGHLKVSDKQTNKQTNKPKILTLFRRYPHYEMDWLILASTIPSFWCILSVVYRPAGSTLITSVISEITKADNHGWFTKVTVYLHLQEIYWQIPFFRPYSFVIMQLLVLCFVQWWLRQLPVSRETFKRWEWLLMFVLRFDYRYLN